MTSSCFHDEFVALLLRKSLDRKEAERKGVVGLLTALTESELLSMVQLVRGRGCTAGSVIALHEAAEVGGRR